MDEANADLTNSSWCNRNNSNETEPSSASRGNYRGGGRGNIRYQSHRGNYNSRWTSRNGRGGKNMNSSNQQKGETDENQKSRKFDKKVANYGIGYQKIEDLCTEMDQKKILPGSAELLASVQVESFYKRLDDLWPDPKKQSDFLRVIVATASTNQSDLRNLTYDFISKVLGSKLIETIVESCICPLMYDTNMQEEPIYAEIAHYIVKLLLLGFISLPSKMDSHLLRVQNVTTSLKEVKDICLKEETKIQLERLEIALKDRQKAKAEQRLTTESKKKEIKDFEGSSGEPPVNFRDLSIVPIPDDISHRLPPYLRPAKDRYNSDEEYLDIQFRLLREDLIRPLRDGITAYRKGGAKETDLYVYNDVELGASSMHKPTGELISFACINVSKRMRWDKRLKYGSLVCLSSDEFQEIFLFATVIERDELPIGKVGLKFEELSKINTKWKYKMVESPAFFEAYRHVMMALKAIEQDEPIPFSNYFVDVETTTLAPVYSIDEKFNFKSLIKTERENTEFYLHELRHLKPDDFGMDESQYNALIYTLISELAILQGPPGTGKTYMGLQIAKLLFDNWSIWNSDAKESRPMLVVCYTNHALDQFLEGISKFVPEGIIRVGGRCKNETVAQFNLSKSRKWDNSTVRNQYFNIRDEIVEIQRRLGEKTESLKLLESRFASPARLMNALNFDFDEYEKDNYIIQSLNKRCGTDSNETLMFKWLTQTDRNFSINLYDINIFRQLMAYNIPEIKAKNALADFYQRGYYPDSLRLFNHLRSPQGQFYSATRLSMIASVWPKLSDIVDVKQMGFTDTVAAELLVRNNVNQIREEYNQSKGIKSNRQLATVNIPEQAEVEEIDELIFKDDDEENRMIVDSNVLEDFQVQEKKKPKDINIDDWFNKDTLPHFLEYITSAHPMTEEEAEEIIDIWSLSLQRRWKLYQYWIKKCRKEVKEKIKTLENEYGEKMKMLIEYRSLGDVDVLKAAKVVGMTTTGAAKHQSTLRALRPRIVIVEEAAEVLEAHIITSLTRACQHLILIGDHKQLRPSPAVYELAKKYKLEISLFERLINNGYPYRMLKNQHRMSPDISRVLMPHFYQDLLDDPSVFERDAVKGVTKNLIFLNHSYPEVTEKEFKSHKNDYEAEFCLRLANYFLQQNYKAEQITILCTYLDQLLDIRKKAYERYGKDHGFVIQSVDNYQGEENDIIILSLVRSNNPENKIGFLKIPNRVCVALSRAKDGLFVIGNFDFLSKNCEMWKEICKSAKEAGAFTNELTVRCQMHQNEQIIQHYNDFDTKCREGGCNIPCNGRLECGHQCIKPCHVEDMDHTKQKCLKSCERKCESEFQHPCTKDCWQACGDCYIKVQKNLPCHHKKLDFCYLDPKDVQCVEDCQKTLSCGHQCKERCGGECTEFCQEIVERQLPICGHTVTVKCSDKLNSIKCNTEVIKKWPLCNHSVKTFCSSNITTLPCPHPCEMILPDCEHVCKGSCGKCRNGRLHIACSKNCNKIFLCEHKCDAKCSKICPPCSKPCETACGHSQCGNQSINGEQLKKTRKIVDQQKLGSKTGRKCGESCPPCMEECLNRCEHRQCSKKCGDPCDVMPCREPCMKLLPCHPESQEKDDPWNVKQHRCIGVCGDECPKLCKICDPGKFEEIQQIFFGNEDEENARFVQLKDCEHIFEVKGLDQWIESSLPKLGDENASVEIVQIKCPQCKTSIRRSNRYISILNERAIDIEQIKQKTRGFTNAEKKKEQMAFQEEAKKVFKEFKEIDFGPLKEVEILEKKLIEAHVNVLTKDWFATSRNILRIIQTLTKYLKVAKENIEAFNERLAAYERAEKYKKHEVVNVTDIKDMPNFKTKLAELKITNFYLLEECNNLIKIIHSFAISELMIRQITSEVQRFGFIVDLLTYFSKAVKHNVDFTETEIQMITEIFENLNGSKEFDDNFEKEMSKKLENLASIHRVPNFGISQKERSEIVQAFSSHGGHWYKCPNGHHYIIGDCGGAVTTAKCPECNAVIGGASHRLLDSNQDAQAEMLEGTGIDGSPYRNPFEALW